MKNGLPCSSERSSSITGIGKYNHTEASFTSLRSEQALYFSSRIYKNLTRSPLYFYSPAVVDVFLNIILWFHKEFQVPFSMIASLRLSSLNVLSFCSSLGLILLGGRLIGTAPSDKSQFYSKVGYSSSQVFIEHHAELLQLGVHHKSIYTMRQLSLAQQLVYLI